MTRKEQKEARKIQIIQATLDLFVERGLRNQNEPNIQTGRD